MSALLRKLNFFTGIYFAIIACYFSCYFQNLRTAVFKELLSVFTSVHVSLLCQAKLYQNGAVSFIYILKQGLFFF